MMTLKILKMLKILKIKMLKKLKMMRMTGGSGDLFKTFLRIVLSKTQSSILLFDSRVNQYYISV